MLEALLKFSLLVIVIIYAGRKLSYYGDIIAEHLGLGKAWVGLILMASVTSMPELTVGIGSAAIVESADLALGDVLGSCAFNLFLLSILDAFAGKEPLSSKASSSHIIAAAMSLILVALVGMGLFLPPAIVISSWIGLSSLVFVVVYFISMRILYHYQLKMIQSSAPGEVAHKPEISRRRAWLMYGFFALFVIGAGLFLPGIAGDIAHLSGLGESFVGTLFLAMSTSLPELAVSLAALRLGSYDLAVGNLFGSNMFNIIILSIDDMAYTRGDLLKDASESNIISVFSVVIMTAIAIVGLSYRSPKKFFFMAWDSIMIALVFIGNLLLLFFLRE